MKKPDLNNTSARQEPFRVPLGYFEQLPSQVMAAIDRQVEQAEPKREAKKVPFYKTELYAKIKPYLYMAAMFGGIWFGIWVYKYQQKIVAERAQNRTADNGQSSKDTYELTAQEMEDYIDDACDYMMLDSRDIMAYVTDEEYGN
ncbi:MAG: hypothetical protein J6X27_06330 [Bacteroidaceae bacterium]|nr:hypothetical protein [Bacteroidaceae bacterium]